MLMTNVISKDARHTDKLHLLLLPFTNIKYVL